MKSSSRQQYQKPKRSAWKKVRYPSGRLEHAYFDCLSKLYWEGVSRDLEDILRTLRAWIAAQETNNIPNLPDYSSGKSELYGFGTFLSKAAGSDAIDLYR
jgi:hypothetical protein